MKIKEYFSKRWLISIFSLGVLTSLLYGLSWGMQATILVACFTAGYQSAYHALGELRFYLTTKKSINEKEVVVQAVIVLVCLIGIFALSGEYKYQAILGFFLLIVITSIVELIMFGTD